MTKAKEGKKKSGKKAPTKTPKEKKLPKCKRKMPKKPLVNRYDNSY